MDRKKFDEISEIFEKIDTLDKVKGKFNKNKDYCSIYNSLHFSLVFDYGPDADRIDLPKELTEEILNVITNYKNKLEEKVKEL